LGCSQRFTTIERLAGTSLLIAKKDGRREEFSRDKLLAGLRKACEKRPLPAGAVDAVADAIETRLRQLGAPEVPSEQVGELVMDSLRELDHIAYIRFASVYRSFADLEELQDELSKLATSAVPGPGQPTLLPDDELQALAKAVRPFAPRKRRGRPPGKAGRPSAPRSIQEEAERRRRTQP
jgi:transcriptional repressor NrdR